jgi:hypothetical protein|tara:strand:- start:3025 stop:3285 length:261 start_codon:yes stop_codon:yes gene_type:complete
MTVDEYKIDQITRDIDLVTLMQDARFNAVWALLSALKDEQVLYTSDPANANEPYRNAHNLGSISAILSIENQLVQIMNEALRDEAT